MRPKRRAGRRDVLPRHRECVERNVGPVDARETRLGGERERDASRAGADVDRHAAAFVAELLEHEIDEVFGLRTRNEHALVDVQREVPEVRPADGVGERRALRAPFDGELRPGANIVVHFDVRRS